MKKWINAFVYVSMFMVGVYCWAGIIVFLVKSLR